MLLTNARPCCGRPARACVCNAKRSARNQGEVDLATLAEMLGVEADASDPVNFIAELRGALEEQLARLSGETSETPAESPEEPAVLRHGVRNVTHDPYGMTPPSLTARLIAANKRR